jgi:hypothetical protein
MLVIIVAQVGAYSRQVGQGGYDVPGIASFVQGMLQAPLLINLRDICIYLCNVEYRCIACQIMRFDKQDAFRFNFWVTGRQIT